LHEWIFAGLLAGREANDGACNSEAAALALLDFDLIDLKKNMPANIRQTGTPMITG